MKKLWFFSAALLASGLALRATAPASAQGKGEGERLYVVTHVDVIPPFTAAGQALIKQFAADSRNDPGSVRFEIMEQLSRPNHAMVVEVWKDRKSFDAHLALDHTKTYRAKLAPMLGSPFDERLHRLVP